MSVLVYVFGAMLAAGGLGLAVLSVYNMVPKAPTQPAVQPPKPPEPGTLAVVLPSQRDYSFDEEEFRNWIEVRDALDPKDGEALKSHVAVLVAIFGKHPEAPSVAKPA